MKAIKATFVNEFTRTGKDNANGKRPPLLDANGEVIKSAKYILEFDETDAEHAEALDAYRAANAKRWDTLVDSNTGEIFWYPWSLVREGSFNVTISAKGNIIPEPTKEEKLLTKAKSISKGVLRQAEKVLAENLLAEFGLGAKVEE